MRDSGWSPVVLLALVLAAGVLAAGYLRGRVTRTAMLVAAIGAVVWIAGVLLMLTGWNDIDGWIDCHDCNGWQQFGAFLFWTLLFLAAFVVAGGAIAGIARRVAGRPR